MRQHVNFDIAIVRSNSVPLIGDPRVQRILKSLSKKYRLVALGWDREAKSCSVKQQDKNILIKHFRLKAPYGRFYLIFYYLPFWFWVIINLLIHKPRIIYSCNLDTLIPSYISKMLFSTKILFDSFDKFAMAFIPPRLRILYKVVDLLENVLSCKVDVLITVSEERLSTFGKCKPKRHEVIMNCPDDLLVKNKNDVSAVDKNDFILVYTGIISYDRGLSLLANAIKEVKGVHLILAGRVAQDIKQLLQNPNVQYLGVLEYEEALNLQGMADAVPILYDPKIPINRVANPNKLFEAMMLGVPVITNVCEEIVKEAGCGVVVEYEYESVKRALQYLVSHPEVRERMGANGRRAFEEKYNWNLQEKRLLKIIEELFDESKKGASGERVCR